MFNVRSMGKFTLLLLSIVVGLYAQVSNHVTCTNTVNQINCSKVQTDYVSPIVDAMKASSEAAAKARQLKVQQEEFQQQLDLQREQSKLDQARQQSSHAETKHPEELQQQLVQLEIDKTLQSLRDRYPDFGLYGSKMADLANRFLPGKSVTAYAYIEGLYMIAKHTAEMKSQADSPATEKD